MQAKGDAVYDEAAALRVIIGLRENAGGRII